MAHWSDLGAFTSDGFTGSVNTTLFESVNRLPSVDLKNKAPNVVHLLCNYLTAWPSNVNANRKQLKDLGGLALDGTGIVSAPDQPSALVANHMTDLIPSATWSSVRLDFETFNVGGLHSNTTNSSRLTAQIGGTYLIGASLGFSINPAGFRLVRLFKNNSTILSYASRRAVSGNVTVVTAATIPAQLTAGDYVELQGYHDAGVSLSTFADFTLAWAVKLG